MVVRWLEETDPQNCRDGQSMINSGVRDVGLVWLLAEDILNTSYERFFFLSIIWRRLM